MSIEAKDFSAATIAERLHSLQIALGAAQIENERTQARYYDGRADEAERIAAEVAIEKIEREIGSLQAASRAIDRERNEAENTATRKQKQEIVRKGFAAAERVANAEAAYYDRLASLQALYDEIKDAKSSLRQIVTSPGGLKGADVANFKSLLNFENRERQLVSSLFYRGGGGEMGLMPANIRLLSLSYSGQDLAETRLVTLRSRIKCLVQDD